MKKLSLILTLCLTLAPTAPVGECQPLTLDRCLRQASAANPTLQQSRLDRSLSRPGRLAAWGQFLPAVSSGYGLSQTETRIQTYLTDDGRVIELPYYTPYGETIEVQKQRSRNSSLFLNVDETLFNGGRNYFNLLNSRLLNEAREYAVSADELDVRRSVIQTYCSALAAQEYLQLSGEVLQQRQRLLQLAQVRFNTGSVTRRDVMQAEVDLGRARNDSLAAVDQLRQSIASLNLLVGLPIDSSYALANLPPLEDLPPSADFLLRETVTDHAELSALRLQTAIKHNNLHAAKGAYLPTATASLSYSRSEQAGGSGDFTLDPRNRAVYYRLNLSWELFDRFTRSLRLQEARVEEQKSRLQQDHLERDIQRRIQAAWDKLQTVQRQINVADQNLKLAGETLRFEEERYRLGSATTLDVGAAQVSYIQARQDRIRLGAEQYSALGDLERAAGLIIITEQQ